MVLFDFCCPSLLPIGPAGGVFGVGGGAAALQGDGGADGVGEKGVPFDLQDDGGAGDGDGHGAVVEKISGAQAGADVVVHGDPDVPGAVDVGLPGVVHDGLGTETLGAHLGIELLEEGAAVLGHPVQIPGYEEADLLRRQGCALLGAETAQLALFLQVNKGAVAVVSADAELLPPVDAVQLLPQGPVRGGVKVQASYLIAPAGGVGVGPGRGPEPAAQGGEVR